MKTLRFLLVTSTLLLALALPMVVRAAWTDAFAHSLFELIDGGPLRETDRRYKGTRYVADPKEWLPTVARRAMESVYGRSLIGDRNREQENLLQEWGTNQETATFYRAVAGVRSGFLPTGPIQFPTGGPGLQTSQQQETPWWTKQLAALNPTFTLPVLELAAQRAAQAQLLTALDVATDQGRSFPKVIGQENPVPASPSGLQDRIDAPSNVTATASTASVFSKLEAIANNPDAGPAASPPDVVLPSLNDSSTEQARVRSAVVRKPNSDEAANASALARQTFPLARETEAEGFAQLSRTTFSATQNIYQYLADYFTQTIPNRPEVLGDQLFGSGGMGSLSQLFSPDRLTNLLRSRLGDGQNGGDRGGGGRTPDRVPDTAVQQPFAGACASRTPLLQEETVRTVAYTLGLPNSVEGPWQVQLRPISNPSDPRLQIANTTGVVPETGSVVTLTEDDFQGEQCAWVVIATGRNEIAVISDRADRFGVRTRLVLSGSSQ